MIELFIPGIPAPKGSLSAFPYRRGDGTLGARMVEGKGNNRHPYQPWAQACWAAAMQWKARGGKRLEGPVVGAVDFYLPRPRRSRWAEPAVKPDVSKLLRGIEDPLNGIAFEDDARIVGYTHVFKHYASDTHPAGAQLNLWNLDEWLLEASA